MTTSWCCPACQAILKGEKSQIAVAFEHTCGEVEYIQIPSNSKIMYQGLQNWDFDEGVLKLLRQSNQLDRAIQLLKQVKAIPNSLFPYEVLKSSIDEFLRSVKEPPLRQEQ